MLYVVAINRPNPRRLPQDLFLNQRYENHTKHFTWQGMQFQWMNKSGDFVEIEKVRWVKPECVSIHLAAQEVSMML